MRLSKIPSKIPWLSVAIFLFIFAAVAAGGYLFYTFQRDRIRVEKQEDLESIAGLKSQQITRWLQERTSDATVLSKSPLLARNVARWFEDPSLHEAGLHTRTRLEAMLAYDIYQSIILCDAQGKVKQVFGRNHRLILGASTLSQVLETAGTGKVIFSDFYQCDLDGEVHLDVFAPLLDGRRTTAVVILRIDPDRFLFPLIQSWPVPRRTAETLIIRREGEAALFLNDLRFRRNAAMRFSIPLTDTLVPAVKAALGREGMVEGRDYRGVPVLACIKKIEGSPWYMVAKVDQEEVYRPIRLVAVMIAGTGLLLVFLSGAVSSLMWQRRQKHLYGRLLEAERQRQALTKHYEYLTKYANDIIFVLDDKYDIIEANQRAETDYGYTREELLRMSAADLRTDDQKYLIDEQLRAAGEKGGTVYETRHRRKDGSSFPVEVSARPIEIDGKTYIQEIVRDITERTVYNETIARRNRNLDILNQCALELASLPPESPVEDVLTRYLKSITGGYAVTFGCYDRDKKEIVLRRILLESKATAVLEKAIGKSLFDVRAPISPEVYREIMSEQIGRRRTLHEVSFGAIPKAVSTAVGALLGLERFVGIVYQVEGTLFGTSLVALKKGQTEPDDTVLRAFASLGAASLRRAKAEENLRNAHEELQASYEEIEANNQELQAAEEELQAQNEQLLKVQEALKASEETYRNLFQNAQVGLFRTRITDGKILESNEQLARMFGYDSREEFIAEYVTSQNYVDPGTRERMLEQIRRHGYVQKFEARFYRKDRSIFWARFSARIYPEKGWIEGVAEDIAQEMLAQEALQKAFEELKVKNERLVASEADLKKQLSEIQNLYEAMLGREDRVRDLKEEVNDLLKAMGRPEKYKVVQ